MKTVLILFTLFSSGYLMADDKFNFNYDYSYFAAESSKIYVEFYYSFNQNELTYKKVTGGYEVKGKILFDVYSIAAGKNIIMKELNIPLVLSDTNMLNKASKLTGQLNMLLDTGAYRLNLKASDYHDSSKSISATEEMVLKAIPYDVFTSSSIQLSSGIVKSSDVNSIFYKNTLEVTPNPSLLFGNNLSKVYYYAELYNIKPGLISDNYSINISITDTDGKVLKSETKNYKIKADSKVEYGSLDISDMPSNKYIFFVKAFDDKNTEILKAFKVFHIYNSAVTDTNVNISELDAQYLASEYPSMSEKNVEKEFDRAIYLLNEKDKDSYEKMNDLDSKRKFMFYIWKRFDPNPATVVSEFKKIYFDRITYANKNFKSDFRAGWKTDRGRIYCLYGKYDDIERFDYEGATRAYEIWTYHNIQGGVLFVFIDMSAGYGNYELVHSTAQNEIHNDNWRDKLEIR